MFVGCTKGQLRQIFYVVGPEQSMDDALEMLAHSTAAAPPTAVFLDTAVELDAPGSEFAARITRASVESGAVHVLCGAEADGLGCELDRLAAQPGWTDRRYAAGPSSAALRHVACGPTRPLDGLPEFARAVRALRSAMPARRRSGVVVSPCLGDGLVSRAVFQLEQHLVAFDTDRGRVENAAAWLQARGFDIIRPD